MNILLISHFFKPYNHIASNRINAMYDYLTEFGHKVIVVTINRDNINYDKEIVALDNKKIMRKFTFEKKNNKIVHKIKAGYNYFYNYLVKDEDLNWVKNAVERCSSIVKEHNIDTIITSYGPFSPLMVGLKLKKKFSYLKWIVDFRDDFSLTRHHKLFLNMMKEVNGITAVSLPILNDLKQRYENINSNVKYCEVKNGYNFERIEPRRKINDVFTVTYSGSFYGKRNPDNFLKVLESLKKENLLTNFKVNFIGCSKPFEIPHLLEKHVNLISKRISYNDSIEYLKKSDVLLLILPNVKEKGVYSGKIFDYLGAGRPILGLVPFDVARDLILETNSGFVAMNEDCEEIKNKILESHEAWLENVIFSPNVTLVDSLSRKGQTKNMEKFLLSV